MVEKILCSDWCFSCYVRAQYQITDISGQKCTYKQTLGFGSSYTLLIPTNFTFGSDVRCFLRHNISLDVTLFD